MGAAALSAALAACAVNRPLGVTGETAGPAYRYDTLSRYTDPARNAADTLVILTLSGGGARSAALGFGVMEQMAAARIAPAGAAPRSVLDELDIVSANSGGAFLAAYYAAQRDAMFRRDPEGLTAFERDFLKRPLTRELLAAAVLDFRRLHGGEVTRTELAAEHFDRIMFGGRRYADLVRLGRPFLIVNAHDTTKRVRFEFTQEQFDLLCSDLGSVPLAHAVMASSAVHGIFTPLRLRNFPLARCPPEPVWIASALRGEGEAGDLLDSPRARRNRALTARWFRNKLPAGTVAPAGADFYVRLADAAAVDNLALRGPLFALASRDSETGLKRLIESGRIRSVVLIVVNAATGPDPLRDADPDDPSALRTMRDAADGLIRTVSEDSLREAHFVFAQLRAAAARRGGRPKVYGPVVIEFDALADARERECLKRIATALDVPDAAVDALRDAGRRLLAAAPEFVRYVRDQGGTMASLDPVPGHTRYCARRR
ncbi:MAG: patatin-like phospholipase family protein [Rhodospirillaceae bacterium]|nr:patatin-like phospholipase family protein [Rhodospirillaceae bacterium]